MMKSVHSRSRMVVTEVPITPATTRRAGRAMMAAVRGLHVVEEPVQQQQASPRTVHDQIREHIGEGVQ